MSRPQQQTTWEHVPPNSCVLDRQGNEWWVMDRRWNNTAVMWEFLLERSGQRIVQPIPDASAPVTMVIWGYSDKIELMRLLLNAEVVEEPVPTSSIATFPEVIKSPDTPGPRVGAS